MRYIKSKPSPCTLDASLFIINHLDQVELSELWKLVTDSNVIPHSRPNKPVVIPAYLDNGPTPPAAKVRVKIDRVSSCVEFTVSYCTALSRGQANQSHLPRLH